MAGKDTYAKQAQNCVCNITLRDLDICKTTPPFIGTEHKVSAEVYQQLVLYTPSRESNLGTKISERLKKHIDELVNEIMKGLDLKHCYAFSAYEPKKPDKTDLRKTVTSQTEPYILLNCSSGFAEALFASIRNALAHGNILKSGNYFYLYALAKEKQQTNDTDKKLSFLLKVYRLDKLGAYIDAFKKYN